METDTIAVSPETLIGEAARLKVDGYRLVTLSCLEDDQNGFEIRYHFDKALTLRQLDLRVAPDIPVPSISRVYAAAFLVENEIQDLFGLAFTDLTIDYRRTLYLDGGQSPPPHHPDPHTD